MNAFWIATLGASLACYLLKLAGFLIPETLLKRPRLQRINELIPVVLLSALVAVQTVSDESKLVIDHRLAGVAVAAVALKMKVSFPIMMMLAAITSAIIYRI